MEKAAKGITPEGITEEIVAEAKEEATEAPSRIGQKLRQLAAVWERASVRSSASETHVMGSGLAGMYSAQFQALSKDQFQALAKDHERVHPDKR